MHTIIWFGKRQKLNQQNIGPQNLTAFYSDLIDKDTLQFKFSPFPGGLYALNI